MPRKPQAQHTQTPQTQPALRQDDDIILMIGKAKNGVKATALLNGNATAYPSASEADAALCALLTYYTRDAAQIDRLYRRSGLYRDKWDEKHSADGRTYGQITIERALSLGGAV